MKKSFLHKLGEIRKSDKLRAVSTEAVLAAFVVLLPFQWDFPPISLFIMLLGVVFLFFFRKNYFKNLRASRFFWPILFYYSLVGIGLAYTDFPREGGLDMQVQIALMAWPLGLAALNVVDDKMIRRVTLYFVRSLALSSALLLILAFSSYLEDGSHHHFFYKHLSQWELVPQHYLSMYLSFGLLILGHRWYFYNSEITPTLKIEILTYGLIFIVMQVLLAVRIQWLALPLSLAPLAFKGLTTGRIGKKSKIAAVLTSLAIVIIFLLLPGTQRRIVETYDEIRSFNEMVERKQTNHRVFLWKYGTEVIGENWVFGTGTGGANKALHEKLLTCEAVFWDGEKIYRLHEKEYNVHNVYLQAWMTHGILGFTLILVILFVPLVSSLKGGDVLTSGFLILCIVSFSTESMLERQAGIMWLAAFYSLLVVSKRKGTVAPNKNTP